MFPFIIPSSLDLKISLTLWDIVSSEKTMGLMFWITVIVLPVIILYTSWVYKIMRGKVTTKDIHDNEHTAY